MKLFTQKTLPEPDSISNPFLRMYSWVLLLILAISFSGFGLGYALFDESHQPYTNLISQLLHYLILWPLLIAYMAWSKVSFTQLLKRPILALPLSRLVGFTVMLFIFTLGIFYCIYWPATFVFPQILEQSVFNSAILFDLDSSRQGWQKIVLGTSLLAVILAVIVAPITEEIFFRGLLFQSLASTGKIMLATLVSSALFALLHGDIFGAFVFAVFMCWLYQQTNSLWAPIIVHILNNALTVIIELLELYADDFVISNALTIEQYREISWLGIVLILISAPWAIGFFRHRTPDQTIPYLFTGSTLLLSESDK